MATSWEHLLGGYATNTLTDEEKRQLYEAALNDQALFDALADEEALKVMLADPEARRRILASLEVTERSGGVSDEKVKWEELRDLLGHEQSALHLSSQPPTVIMMVGLQGSGKTTTTGKLFPAVWDKPRSWPLWPISPTSGLLPHNMPC